jgi:hypothetical protein
MAEGSGAIPALHKLSGLRLAGEHQLDDGPARGDAGEEKGAGFSAVEIPLQRELPAGKLAFALFPIGHLRHFGLPAPVQYTPCGAGWQGYPLGPAGW